MAFSSQNLSVLAYANGFTLWHYKSADASTSIDTSGYFNNASNMLRAGDMIMANTASGGSPLHGVFVVASNANGIVDIANLVQLNTANTD